MDKTVGQKLKEYLDAGKPYQEASDLLVSQGFTTLKILDAKIALDNIASSRSGSELDISAHPELASSLLEATETMSKKERGTPQETNAMFPTSIGVSYFRKIKGNVYWLLIGALVILIAVFVLAKVILSK